MTAVQSSAESLAPHDVRFRQFPIVRKGGLDPDAVGAFLYDLSEELARRDELEDALRGVAEQAHADLERMRSGQPPVAADVQQAQAAAEEIVGRAHEEARQIVADARRRVSGMYAQAEQLVPVAPLAFDGSNVIGQGADLGSSIRQQAQAIDEAGRQLVAVRHAFQEHLVDIIEAARDAQQFLRPEDVEEADVVLATSELNAGVPS